MSRSSEASVETEEVADFIAEGLIPGRKDALRKLFDAHGARAPMVYWAPDSQDMMNPLLRRFHKICSGWMGADDKVKFSAFKIEELGKLAQWLMLVDVIGDPDAPEDFRYSFYGDGIIRHYGQDMTGSSVRVFKGHISQFMESVYLAAARRQESVLTEHEPPQSVFVRGWRRLIVPLFDDDLERIKSFAVLNVAENELRAGLELMPDPVFVADNSQTVVFANRAALRSFNLGNFIAPGATLHQLTGISLDDHFTPDELLADNSTHDSVQLSLRGGLAERFGMTVSAAQHRDNAYYVVVMRVEGS